MIDREEEEDNVGVSEQFVEPVNSSKQNTGLEIEITCPFPLKIESQESSPQTNKKPKEMKWIQLSADTQEKSESTVVEEDNHQTDETKNSPLWSMYFDGSCTRTNVDVGVLIWNTENNHT